MGKTIDSVMDPVGKCKIGVEREMDDATYRGCGRLNTSSITAGMLPGNEIDVVSIRDAFEGNIETSRAKSSQDRMDRGTLAHLALMQPELISQRVAVWSGGRRAGKVWDEFSEWNYNKIIIPQDEFGSVMAAVSQIKETQRVRELFSGADVEVSLFSEEQVGSDVIYCCGRADAIKRDGDITYILDFKTTETGIDSRSVNRTICDFKYREKMACYRRWYCQVTGEDSDSVQCILVFGRITYPYGVRIMKITTLALDWGEWKLKEAINAVAPCIKSRSWPIFSISDVSNVNQWELPAEERMEDEIEY